MTAKNPSDDARKAEPTFAQMISDAQSLEETALILRRALEGETGTDGEGMLPHRYVAAVHGELPRQVREELELAVLRLLTRLADGEAWQTNAAVELLLLSRTVFASRSRAAGAELAVTRIFQRMHRYPRAIVIAAGQAAIGLGYYGAPTQWHRLYDLAGNDSVPTVIGGLMKTDWQALLGWLRDRLPDSFVERTLITLMPYFFATQSASRVTELVNAVWDEVAEDVRRELRTAMVRAGLDMQTAPHSPVSPPALRENWREELRALFAGERETEIQGAGGAAQYLRGRLEAAGTPEDHPAFAKALKEGITRWQIGPSGSLPPLQTLCSIIAEFRQPAGIAKLLDLLEERADTELDEAKPVRDASFDTLSRIYTTPPQNPERDKTYARYANVLRRLVMNKDMATRAFHTLLEFDAVDFDDRDFASAVVNSEATFTEAFEFAMSGRAEPSKPHLSWLLDACVETDDARHLEHFVDLLKERNRSVAVRFNAIEVTPGLSLTTRRDLRVRYAMLIGVFVNRGYETYRSVVNDKD
jgi:hypothetical protein